MVSCMLAHPSIDQSMLEDGLIRDSAHYRAMVERCARKADTYPSVERQGQAWARLLDYRGSRSYNHRSDDEDEDDDEAPRHHHNHHHRRGNNKRGRGNRQQQQQASSKEGGRGGGRGEREEEQEEEEQ